MVARRSPGRYAELLRHALNRRGISARRLSLDVCGNPEAVRSILQGHAPSVDRWEAICTALGIDVRYDLQDTPIAPSLPSSGPRGNTPWRVPLMGTVAAGGGDNPQDCRLRLAASVNHDDRQWLPHPNPPPPDSPSHNVEPLEAFCVEGASMEPLYHHGDTIFIRPDDPSQYLPERLIGRDCVVLIDGPGGIEMYLKRLRRADSGRLGEWNLESLNAHGDWRTMVNQRPLRALPVRYVARNV